MKLIYIGLALLMSGCSIESSVSDEDLNKIVTCIDTRDGETFQFCTNHITNANVGLYVGSFDIVDLDGNERTLSRVMENFMKCEKRPAKAGGLCAE